MRMPEADWDAVIAVNLKGTFNCTKAASKVMLKQRRGKIVNIASIIGIIGKKPQMLFYGLFFIFMHFLTSLILLSSIYPGFFGKSDGKWVSPKRLL